MLTTRLEKLENDLNLLNAFQSILLTESDHEDIENGNTVVEIPERDSSNKFRKHKGQNCSHRTNPLGNNPQTNKYDGSKTENSSTTKITSKVRQSQTSEHQNSIELENYTSKVSVEYPSTTTEISQCDDNPHKQERKNFEIELNLQRAKCIDLEESAKLIAIKLQKVEDELSRERETKKMLLVGTLQLKNQIQGCENRISKLLQEIAVKKNENVELAKRIESLEKYNFEIETQTNFHAEKLRMEKISVDNDNKILQDNLQELKNQIENLQKQNSLKDQDLHNQDVKVASHVSQIMSKCVQLRNENEKFSSNLIKAVEREKAFEDELLLTKKTLKEMAATHKRDKAIHACLIKNLQSDQDLRKEQCDEQLKACHVVLSRTKAIFVGFQQERRQYETSLTKNQKELTKLKKENQIIKKQFSELLTESRALKERLNCMLLEKMEKVQQLEKEIMTLDYELKKSNVDKERLTKELNVVKSRFSHSKKQLEDTKVEFDNEKSKLREDHSRLQQNCQVLQKVSEDQGQTIQKLRGEVEDLRKLKFELDTQIREGEADEKILVRKLETETKNNLGLRDHIEELEYQIESLEEDMRQHSCQDFVDSQYTEKLESLESKLKSRYSEWQRALFTTKSERDQAVAAVGKAKEAFEEAKERMEKSAFQLSKTFSEEKAILQKEFHKSESEKSNKIYELESELERLRLQSTQMQRNLASKIQQLQYALGVCLGSTNPTTTSSFLNAGCGTGFGNSFM